MTTPQGETFLYRLSDAEGVLLYVGISNDLDTRLATHQREKPWAHLIARCDYEPYDTRRAAEMAEEAAIKTKSPKYNVIHSDRKPVPLMLELAPEWITGLDILARAMPGGVPGNQRREVLYALLARELSARGLLGDAPCWHAGIQWPSGVRVVSNGCGCGQAVTPDGAQPERA